MTSASENGPGGGSEGSDETAKAFREGRKQDLSAVRKRVRRILGFRGYRIPREERRDLEQEVMTQLWRSASQESFQPGAGFWGFVETVTARRCIDWVRSHRGRPEAEPLSATLAGPEPGPLDAMVAREQRDRGLSVFADLSKPCRDLIYLQMALGLPYREIAALLGTTEGAARVRLHRCLEQARQALFGAERRSLPADRETD